MDKVAHSGFKQEIRHHHKHSSTLYVHCVQKKHPLTFSFISLCKRLDLHKIFRKSLKGIKYSIGAKVIHSSLPVTSYFHVCKLEF